MKCEEDYIRKYGEELGKQKYITYINWKNAEEKRRQKPGYWKWRCKRSAEVHKKNKTDKRHSLILDCPGLPHKNRWEIYSKDYTNIENYELAKADNFKGWHCHHRLELHPDGSIRFSRNSLIKLNLYINRPASELIFLRASEHTKLHGVNRWE
jgi:hypothetical protein